MKRTVSIMLVLIVPLGLASLLALALPVLAEPSDVTPLPPVEKTDGRAGACYSFYYDPAPSRPFVQMAREAGSRWDRFDFNWRNIETSNDSWFFDAYDTLVDDLDAEGMNMVGILLWTPDWAATGGLSGRSLDRRPAGWYAPVSHQPLDPQTVSAASSPPQGLYLAWDDANNHWGDYVYTIVSRYGDRVKHWEMWNEPEWDYFWSGSSTDYAQLLKVGYQATKAACPDCTVLFGGLHYWQNPSYYRWVLSQINQDPAAPQNNYFFDVMSVHLYSRSSSIYDEIDNIRSGMRIYNVGDHPVWLTETGAPIWGDPHVAYKPKYDFAATQEQAAAYVIQSYANAWAADVERYFFFRVHDADMGEYFGLIRNDHSLRPAYVAYQVAASYLVSPTMVTDRARADGARQVTLWGTPRGKISVLWNESPTAVSYALSATLDSAALVDRWGNTTTVAATDELYSLTLPAATANLVSNPNDYFIGGDPLVVVESEMIDEPPTSTVNPLPAVVHSATLTVTWAGQDSESGVWLYDVQVRDGEDGAWNDWLQLTPLVYSQFAGQNGHTYYFRSRAIDRIGNREAWPDQPQARVRFDLPQPLHLSVGGFFADENRNEAWDLPITDTGEITLTQVALQFQDESGRDVLSPTVGSNWEFTTTVFADQTYRLWAISADHMRTLSFTWPSGEGTYTETYPALGLWPVTRIYLPLATRNRQ